MSDLQKHYAPLTAAEAQVVMRRMEETGRPEAEVVAEVKSERVGPAARWDAELVEAAAQEALAEESEEAPDEVEEVPEVEDDELEELESDTSEGELLILASTDDEFTAWLVDTSVSDVVKALEEVSEESQATAAIRIRDWETLRGSDARSTLLRQVEPYAEEASS